MPPSRPWLVAPAVLAAAAPVLSAVVAGAAVGAGLRSGVLAAMPFVLLAVLATKTAWARTGYEVAASVGVALTAWGAAALQTGGAAPSVMRATMGAVMLQVWPVAVLSVMITVLAVRQAFVGPRR